MLAGVDKSDVASCSLDDTGSCNVRGSEVERGGLPDLVPSAGAIHVATAREEAGAMDLAARYDNVQCGAQARLVAKPVRYEGEARRRRWAAAGPGRSRRSRSGVLVCRARLETERTSSRELRCSALEDLLLLGTRTAGASERHGLGHPRVLHLEEDSGPPSAPLAAAGARACFATLSAPAYSPPAGTLGRPGPKRGWIAGGVVLSLVAGLVAYIHWAETKARRKLVRERGDNVVIPPPPPEMVERYERAKASVEQTSMINRAVGALQKNDTIKCIVEVELALEQNRTARCSVTSDFYEEGQLPLLYRTALKVWLDGYPLDYGKLLQLRELLAIPAADAEAIEADVQRQSDVYVI